MLDHPAPCCEDLALDELRGAGTLGTPGRVAMEYRTYSAGDARTPDADEGCYAQDSARLACRRLTVVGDVERIEPLLDQAQPGVVIFVIEGLPVNPLNPTLRQHRDSIERERRACARAREPLATLVVVSRDAHGTVDVEAVARCRQCRPSKAAAARPRRRAAARARLLWAPRTPSRGGPSPHYTWPRSRLADGVRRREAAHERSEGCARCGGKRTWGTPSGAEAARSGTWSGRAWCIADPPSHHGPGGRGRHPRADRLSSA
jgi:hypothetical protein